MVLFGMCKSLALVDFNKRLACLLSEGSYYIAHLRLSS
jgi:hypothetical protein